MELTRFDLERIMGEALPRAWETPGSCEGFILSRIEAKVGAMTDEDRERYERCAADMVAAVRLFDLAANKLFNIEGASFETGTR